MLREFLRPSWCSPFSNKLILHRIELCVHEIEAPIDAAMTEPNPHSL